MGGRTDRQFRQRALAHPFLKGLGELDGVDVVDAGRLRTDAQRLVVAAQAEDGSTPRAAAPWASLSSAMRLRSRVTMDSTAGRPSPASKAAHARAEP